MRVSGEGLEIAADNQSANNRIFAVCSKTPLKCEAGNFGLHVRSLRLLAMTFKR